MKLNDEALIALFLLFVGLMRKMTNERIRVEILIQENIVPQLNSLANHLQAWGNESDLASIKLDKIINNLNDILNENDAK